MQTVQNHTANFRPDIEGLRAIAVLLVVVFHINASLIPGGFIGVDLFFVISGYVITQRICADNLSTPGDFLEFYRRRLRRIAPAMFFVTGTTIAGGAFILLPDDLVQLVNSAIATAFSAANIYFSLFLDTGYFAADSRTVPLLHMWSLGVEEQFYLIWPFLLFVLLRYRRWAIPTSLTIIVLSIACGEYWLRTNNLTSAYYMLPSRAFQLCSGGLAFFLAQSTAAQNASPKTLLLGGVMGSAVVIASAVFLDETMPFPGIYAVPLTAGAIAILVSGVRRQALVSALSIWPARQIGKISYSMYLWHWPLLAYMRYVGIDVSLVSGIVVFLTTVILSIGSYRLIEEPFRHSRQSFSNIFIKMAAIPAVAVILAGIAISKADGVIPFLAPANYRENLALIQEQTKQAPRYPYVCQASRLSAKQTQNPKCLIGSGNNARTLVWGDSNASHYIGILGELAKVKGTSFRNIAHSACPPLLQNAGHFVFGGRARDCDYSSNLVTTTLLFDYDHIIISAAYSNYLARDPGFLAQFENTISSLRKSGKRVTVLGQVVAFPGYDRLCAAKAIRLPINCLAKQQDRSAEIASTNLAIKELVSHVEGAEYYDFNSLICPNGVCSPYRQGTPLYFNSTHLSVSGSWILGEVAVRSNLYNRLF
ncbi:acyltransferase family protein [Rhizobium sp. S96]|uniref:acyltransferase family protein n=1 Tax=Rhizobium sp. S96 TaxID=3055140 RepID=UPI0025AB0BAB|nr:acyltransferase family protein [Rhizobium sp. S96]MDM9618748.1 acyltransferase family protein [Rhizobium sp. S96]